MALQLRDESIGFRARFGVNLLVAFILAATSASPIWRARTRMSPRRTWGTASPDVESRDSDVEDQDFGTAQLGCSDFAHNKAGRCFIDGLSAYPG